MTPSLFFFGRHKKSRPDSEAQADDARTQDATQPQADDPAQGDGAPAASHRSDASLQDLLADASVTEHDAALSAQMSSETSSPMSAADGGPAVEDALESAQSAAQDDSTDATADPASSEPAPTDAAAFQSNASQSTAEGEPRSEEASASSANVAAQDAAGEGDATERTPAEKNSSEIPGEAAAEETGVATDPVTALLDDWRDKLWRTAESQSGESVATLDLGAAHPSGIAMLYAGHETPLSSLYRDTQAREQAQAAMRAVSDDVDTYLRDFGVSALFLGYGMATWAGHKGRVPVLLRPVHLSGQGTQVSLRLSPTVMLHPRLVAALTEAGSTRNMEEIATSALSDDSFTPGVATYTVKREAESLLTDYDCDERMLVGCFLHPAQALLQDFDATRLRAQDSALVQALAGDDYAREVLAAQAERIAQAQQVSGAVSESFTGAADAQADRDPHTERGIGDLDVSVHQALAAVGAGVQLAIDTAPGVDLAATLAAIAADAAACGRSVIHVPATSEDGHLVAARLREAGLGHMVVDLGGTPYWREEAGAAIRRAMACEGPRIDTQALTALRDDLAASREQLSRYVRALHTTRDPWGVSAYDALLELAELTSGRSRVRTTARIAPEFLVHMDDTGRVTALAALNRADRLGLFTGRADLGAWRGVTLTDIDDATDTLRRLTTLAQDLLPTVISDIHRTVDAIALTRPETLAQWCEQLEMLDGVRESLDIFLPEVFERSAADMVIATATKQWRADHDVDMSASDRRRYIRQAKDLVRPGVEVRHLHEELVTVQYRREAWRKYDNGGGWPRLPHGLDAMQRTAFAARDIVDALDPVLSSVWGAPLRDVPLTMLEQRVTNMAHDDVNAHRLPELNQVLQDLDGMGLSALVNDLSARHVTGDLITEEFTYCWWSSVLAAALHDPDMSGMDPAPLAELTARVRRLDRQHVDTLAAPLVAAWAQRLRDILVADKPTARDLFRRAAPDSGTPLSELIATFPMALQAVPIWIIPPTVVPQVFTEDSLVDVALIDASGNLPIEQVLATFVRAQQVVVVGDAHRKQAGMTSALSQVLPQVHVEAPRHDLPDYVASFMADHGYGDAVPVIPERPGVAPLSLDLVDGRGIPAPGSIAVETSEAEVERVLDHIIEHALSRPDESLAVVAFNERHARAIRGAVRTAMIGSPALEQLCSSARPEPFVVVDAEHCHGLRRDRVIVSVGFAKTPHGRTIHSFGTISEPGGMEQVIDALCVSRGHTQVVSSMAPEDITIERLQAPGPRLLHNMLHRAALASRGQMEQLVTGEVPDRLLVDLAEQLWRKGLIVLPRYGTEDGLRIPLAIGHPDYPGELFVAIITDDADYVAEPSVRRRDRYWVERLEQRGWQVHMAFSVAVFVDPEEQASIVEEMILDILRRRSARSIMEAQESPSYPELDEGAAAQMSAGGGAHVNDLTLEVTRAPRPDIVAGLPLTEYSDEQFDEMIAWVRSDGQARSEEEEVEELRQALAVTRAGSGVLAVLTNVVRRSRQDAPGEAPVGGTAEPSAELAAGMPEAPTAESAADVPAHVDADAPAEPALPDESPVDDSSVEHFAEEGPAAAAASTEASAEPALPEQVPEEDTELPEDGALW